MSSNTSARPSCCEERGIRGGDLHDRAVRAQAAPEDDERAALVERVVGGADHVAVHDLRAGDVLRDGRPLTVTASSGGGRRSAP